MKRILFVTLMIGLSTALIATNPPPPPNVPVCDVSDEWLEKSIEVNGLLTHFEIPADSPPATPDLKLTSDACATSKPIVVSLSSCGRCECWETRSEEIWNVIKRLRASNIKAAKMKARGKLYRNNDQKFRYLFKVDCIQRIVAE